MSETSHTECRAGFLIVKTHARLLREYAPMREYTPLTDQHIYAVPTRRVGATPVSPEYRGIDREPLVAWPAEMLQMTQEELRSAEKPPANEERAILAMDELELDGRVADVDLILGKHDALHILSLIEPPVEREVIWVSDTSSGCAPPDGIVILGYEPTWFWGDHFSALCDTMFFPRWHGTDLEGKLFAEYFRILNGNGLFDSVRDAKRFQEFYESLGWWAETGPYVIAVVGAVLE